jgi:hypothetical protein
METADDIVKLGFLFCSIQGNVDLQQLIVLCNKEEGVFSRGQLHGSNRKSLCLNGLVRIQLDLKLIYESVWVPCIFSSLIGEY